MDFSTLYRKMIDPKPMLLLVLVVCLSAMAGPTSAQAQAAKAGTHTVQSGDNLSSIARQAYGDAALWRVILNANPQVRDPRQLVIGDVLAIPAADSIARRRVRRRTAGGLEFVKLEPRIHSTPIEAEVVIIPRGAIAPFIDRPRVLSPAEIDGAPYIVGQTAGRLVGGSGDHVFVRGLRNAGTTVYGIYREGGPFYDVLDGAAWGGVAAPPAWDKGVILGYEGILVGEAEVLKFDPDGESTLVVKMAHQEVSNGDLVLEMPPQVVQLDYEPHYPANPVSGSVIKIPAGTTRAGQFDMVVLNVGEGEGLKPGNLLDVFQVATTSYDTRLRINVDLPAERVGLLMILRSYDGVSFAIVLEAVRTIHISDRVTGSS